MSKWMAGIVMKGDGGACRGSRSGGDSMRIRHLVWDLLTWKCLLAILVAMSVGNWTLESGIQGRDLGCGCKFGSPWRFYRWHLKPG